MNQKLSHCIVYFLNYDLGLRYSGIESSALLRSQLFARQFESYVTILTYKYRSHFSTEISVLKQNRKLPVSTIVVNIYDYLQQFYGCAENNHFIEVFKNKVPLKNNEKIQCTHKNGLLKAYVFYNQINNRLHYIDHFEKDIKRSRDYYHESGHLSCRQIFSDIHKNRVEQETFYQPGLKICLIQNYIYDEAGKRTATRYQVFDKEAQLVESLSSEENFISYCLDQYFKQQHRDICNDQSQMFLIIDKNRFFYRPVMRLKSKLEFSCLKALTVIHNQHEIYNEKKGSFRINVNYLDVFEDIAAPDAVIVQTHIQQQKIFDRFGDTGNIYAIPHPYVANHHDQQLLSRNCLKAVYFARYAMDKKHELAIEAFSKVVEILPKAEFHCFGTGDRLGELIKLVKDLGMTKNIFLHGWCDNVSIEYESAALSIISSPSESFGLTIAESLAHGCPVIAFDVPYGAQELVQSNENGYLVPFGDTQAMADKVLEIMQNSALQVRLSNNARQSAERYSEKTVGEKWLQLFQAMIKN